MIFEYQVTTNTEHNTDIIISLQPFTKRLVKDERLSRRYRTVLHPFSCQATSTTTTIVTILLMDVVALLITVPSVLSSPNVSQKC